jgi:hypothetical protein
VAGSGAETLRASIETALNDPSMFGANNVVVTAVADTGTSSSYQIRFVGRLANTNLPQLTTDITNIQPAGAQVGVSTLLHGEGNEVQTVSLSPTGPLAPGGQFKLLFNGFAGSNTALATGVTSISITSPGTGYTSAPTVVFTGGGGTGAAAVTTIVAGTVTAITITNPGSGYTSAPTISFTGGATTSAAATATIGATPLLGSDLLTFRPFGSTDQGPTAAQVEAYLQRIPSTQALANDPFFPNFYPALGPSVTAPNGSVKVIGAPGGPFTVVYTGDLQFTDVPQLTQVILGDEVQDLEFLNVSPSADGLTFQLSMNGVLSPVIAYPNFSTDPNPTQTLRLNIEQGLNQLLRGKGHALAELLVGLDERRLRNAVGRLFFHRLHQDWELELPGPCDALAARDDDEIRHVDAMVAEDLFRDALVLAKDETGRPAAGKGHALHFEQ